MNIRNKKREFMHREICSLCFLAALGMARKILFYARNADRETIKKYLRNKLWELGVFYSKNVSDREHLAIIKKLQKDIVKKFSSQLSSSGFTFGRAQKLFNLYLKYMWVCGYIKEPPHCPVDSIILGKLGKKFRGKSFTKMVAKDYVETIAAIREIAGEQSVAEWELIVFNRR